MGMTVALLLCTAIAPGQDPAPGLRNSIAVRAGYAWAQGEWTRHPYAPVSYFSQSLVIGGDFSFPVSDNGALAVIGVFSNLSTKEWNDFARTMGDTVDGSASLGFLAFVYRAFLKNTGPDLFSVDIGPVMLLSGGSEKIGTRSFDYDFMSSPRFGALAALEYDRCVTDNLALTLRLEGMFVPSALQYADGHSPSLLTFPLTVGVRIMY